MGKGLLRTVTKQIQPVFRQHRGAANLGDQGGQLSDRIDHLKTADAADLEMGVLFLCEVDAFTGESTNAQEMNVTSGHGEIVTITHVMFLEYVLHYVPPAGLFALFSAKT